VNREVCRDPAGKVPASGVPGFTRRAKCVLPFQIHCPRNLLPENLHLNETMRCFVMIFYKKKHT
jgi:hypothetical protein